MELRAFRCSNEHMQCDSFHLIIFLCYLVSRSYSYFIWCADHIYISFGVQIILLFHLVCRSYLYFIWCADHIYISFGVQIILKFHLVRRSYSYFIWCADHIYISFGVQIMSIFRTTSLLLNTYTCFNQGGTNYFVKMFKVFSVVFAC